MTTRTITTRCVSLLAAVCCTVLLGASGPSTSSEVAGIGARDFAPALNLGLATTDVMLLDGNNAVFTVSEPAQHLDLNGDGDMQDGVVHVFDAKTGEVRNLGLSIGEIGPDNTGDGIGNSPLLKGRVLAFMANERSQGSDLNGDGDTIDRVLHVYDTQRGLLRNLRLETGSAEFAALLSDGRRLVFGVDEWLQGGQDLNQDGDSTDTVLHAFDSVTGRVQNTGLAVFSVNSFSVVLNDRWIAVSVPEGKVDSGATPSGQGQVDLNGNGTLTDVVVHLVDTAKGRSTNLRLAAARFDFDGFSPFKVGAGVALVPVPELRQKADLNGDRDLNDVVLQVVDLATARVRNTGLATGSLIPPAFDAERGLAAFNVRESEQGTDLNGDGDLEDAALHVLTTRTGRVRKLPVDAFFVEFVSKGRAVLLISEFAIDQNSNNPRDLNGDGDQNDLVFGLADLSREKPLAVNTRRAFSFAGSNGEDVVNLPIPVDPFPLQVSGDFATFLVSEAEQGNRDLNGDGDTEDFVLHVADLSKLTTFNSGLSGSFAYRSVAALSLPPTEGRIVVPVRESRQGGRDLNRDGDAEDMVLQLLDLRSGRSFNTGFAATTEPTFAAVAEGTADGGFNFEVPLLIRGRSFVSMLVSESGADLNSDGDTTDRVLHLFDVATGKLTNTRRAAAANINRGRFDLDFNFTGLAGSAGLQQELQQRTFVALVPGAIGPGLGDAYTFIVSEAAQGNVDLNGDGDTDDFVVHATRLTDRDRNGRLDFAEAGTSR